MPPEKFRKKQFLRKNNIFPISDQIVTFILQSTLPDNTWNFILKIVLYIIFIHNTVNIYGRHSFYGFMHSQRKAKVK